MRATLFTDDIHFMAPEGMLEQVHTAARDSGQPASEFLRAAVRERLVEAQANGNGGDSE